MKSNAPNAEPDPIAAVSSPVLNAEHFFICLELTLDTTKKWTFLFVSVAGFIALRHQWSLSLKP